jgi:hypothetical protein
MMRRTSFNELSERTLQAVEQVEEQLRLLLPRNSFRTLLDPLVQWLPASHSEVPLEELMKRFINRAQLTGPCHASLLHGGLCSLLYAVCATMAYDHTIEESAEQLVTAGMEAWRQWIADTQRDVEQLLNSCPADNSSPCLGPSLAAVAALLVQFYSIWLLAAFCFPNFIAQTIGVHPAMSINQPLSVAVLDQVIDEMGISGHQLQLMHDVMQIYDELQVPINRQKSAIAARMSKLLAERQEGRQAAAETPALLGPTSGLSEQCVAAAAGWAVPCLRAAWVNGSGGGEAAAAAAGTAISNTCRTASATNPTGLGAAHWQPSPAGSPLAPFLSDGVHGELLSLAAKIMRIEVQCQFMDLCCSHVAAGVLTWGQLGRFFVSMQPQQPSLTYLTRRLSVRAAQHCLSPWLGNVPTAPGPRARWSPPPPPPPPASGAAAAAAATAPDVETGAGVVGTAEVAVDLDAENAAAVARALVQAGLLEEWEECRGGSRLREIATAASGGGGARLEAAQADQEWTENFYEEQQQAAAAAQR